MTEQHPITPPLEMVEQWRNMPEYVSQLGTMSTVTITTEKLQDIATQAARWGADEQFKLDAEQINQAWQAGADQELEACEKWLSARKGYMDDFDLRASRRPKSPSLKKLALKALDEMNSPLGNVTATRCAHIRRALEQLPE